MSWRLGESTTRSERPNGQGDHTAAVGGLARLIEDVCNRQRQATLALAARLTSDPTWRPQCDVECDPTAGGALVAQLPDGQIRGRCPLRHDRYCPIARSEARSQADRVAHWLTSHGVDVAYHSADLAQVDESVRPRVEGYLERLASHVNAGQGLLIMGRPGRGKTSILALIARRALQLGIRGVYLVRSYDLYDALCGRGTDAELVESRARHCALLLLDDFGAAYEHDFPAARLEGVMEGRSAGLLATCVTTNLSRSALCNHQEYQRTYDRWRARCWGVTLPEGESRREAPRGEP
jgi:hypothetical protein